MEIRADSINFGRAKGSGPRTATKDIDFGRTVVSANAVLTGSEFGFSPSDDHHLGRVTIQVNAATIGTTVRVTATFGVRDWSGNWDDNYEGKVAFAVLAELA